MPGSAFPGAAVAVAVAAGVVGAGTRRERPEREVSLATHCFNNNNEFCGSSSDFGHFAHLAAVILRGLRCCFRQGCPCPLTFGMTADARSCSFQKSTSDYDSTEDKHNYEYNGVEAD